MAMTSGRTQTETSYNEMFNQGSRGWSGQGYSIAAGLNNRRRARSSGRLGRKTVGALDQQIEKASGPQRHPVHFRINRMKRQRRDRIVRQDDFQLALAQAFGRVPVRQHRNAQML